MKLHIHIGLNTLALFAYTLAAAFILITASFLYFTVYKTYYNNLRGLDSLLTKSETFDIEKIQNTELDKALEVAKNKGKRCTVDLSKSPFD